MQKKLFLYSAILVVSIFLLNKVANMFYWYSGIDQFDMFMHTLGGIFLAIWGAALLFALLKDQKPLLWIIVLTAFVLILGFIWEVFEFSLQGIMQLETIANIPDSLSDMVFDMFGGLIGAIFVVSRVKRYNILHDK